MHFTLAEFCASTTAARRGIDNTLPAALEAEARNTLAMLERIRAHLGGVPVVITSGFRCLALNRAIGSSDTSDHVRACAADIRAPQYGTAAQVARALAPHVDTLGIGQLILEFPGPNAWVHVSTRKPAKALNRVITISAAGTVAGVQA